MRCDRPAQRLEADPLPQLDALPPDAFVRLSAVMGLSGLRRSTIYEQVKLGRFPAPVKLTAHAAGWRVSAIRSWLENPADWTPVQGRDLP